MDLALLRHHLPPLVTNRADQLDPTRLRRADPEEFLHPQYSVPVAQPRSRHRRASGPRSESGITRQLSWIFLATPPVELIMSQRGVAGPHRLHATAHADSPSPSRPTRIASARPSSPPGHPPMPPSPVWPRRQPVGNHISTHLPETPGLHPRRCPRRWPPTQSMTAGRPHTRKPGGGRGNATRMLILT